MKYSCLQESSSDCGFCALKVLLANLNNDSNYLSLENKKQGSYSMLDIKKLALEYKLELEGYKVEDSSLLYTLTFPFICQIKRGKENHFVIVEKIKKGIFYVFDPSIGSLEINESIFLELFNQNVLTIKSHEKFKLNKEKKNINSWLLLSIVTNGFIGISLIITSLLIFKGLNSIYSYISMGVVLLMLLANALVNNKYMNYIYESENVDYANFALVSQKIKRNVNYYGQIPLKVSLIILMALIIIESTKIGYLNIFVIVITFAFYYIFNYLYTKQSNAIELLENSQYDLHYVLSKGKRLVTLKMLYMAILILLNAFMVMRIMKKMDLTGIDYFIFNMSLNLTILKLLNDIIFPRNK